MSKEKMTVVIKIIMPLLAMFLWLLLYFTVLWRLPFTCNLNRVKLPEGCKELATGVVWSGTEIAHIKAERIFSSKKSKEEIEDYINKNNRHLGRIEFGWWSCPEFEHSEAVSPDDYPQLRGGGYYDLSYSTKGIYFIDTIVFLTGVISAMMVGVLAYFFMGKILRGVEIPVMTCSFISGCWLNTCISLPLSLFTFMYLGVVGFLLWLMIVLGFVFGIIAWKKGGYKIAVAGIFCSISGLSIAVGSLCVYFLIASF